MKFLLLITGLFFGVAMQAQTYAPYTGNKANQTAVSKPAPAKNEKTKPAAAEKAPVKEEEKPGDDFQDFMKKAIEQLHQKDYQKALGFYTQALEVSTEQSACIALVSRATLYAIMKDDEKAVADLTTAIKTKGTPEKQLAIIYMMRAKLYANNKNMDLACKDLAKAKAHGLADTLIEGVDCK
jgi:tetratricopeptide (TPR) repeat protein